MSERDMLIRAREIADKVGVEYVDLYHLSTVQQVAAIRDRVARKVYKLREEMLGLKSDRRVQRLRNVA